MPSATPSLSVFCMNGVTRVTYLAPLHGFSSFNAQLSVSPPTLSRIRSNLKDNKVNQTKMTNGGRDSVGVRPAYFSRALSGSSTGPAV